MSPMRPKQFSNTHHLHPTRKDHDHSQFSTGRSHHQTFQTASLVPPLPPRFRQTQDHEGLHVQHRGGGPRGSFITPWVLQNMSKPFLCNHNIVMTIVSRREVTRGSITRWSSARCRRPQKNQVTPTADVQRTARKLTTHGNVSTSLSAAPMNNDSPTEPKLWPGSDHDKETRPCRYCRCIISSLSASSCGGSKGGNGAGNSL